MVGGVFKFHWSTFLPSYRCRYETWTSIFKLVSHPTVNCPFSFDMIREIKTVSYFQVIALVIKKSGKQDVRTNLIKFSLLKSPH